MAFVEASLPSGCGAEGGPCPAAALLRDLLQHHDVFWLSLGPGAQDSLMVGRRVEARVRHVGPEVARLALPDFNGLEAVLQVGSGWYQPAGFDWGAASHCCVTC